MEDNFYIGLVHHEKKFLKTKHREKVVLYSRDYINYIDLINNTVYSTDSTCKDYVVKESLVPTDISEHRIDYMYLLSKYNSGDNLEKKKTRILN